MRCPPLPHKRTRNQGVQIASGIAPRLHETSGSESLAAVPRVYATTVSMHKRRCRTQTHSHTAMLKQSPTVEGAKELRSTNVMLFVIAEYQRQLPRRQRPRLAASRAAEPLASPGNGHRRESILQSDRTERREIRTCLKHPTVLRFLQPDVGDKDTG